MICRMSILLEGGGRSGIGGLVLGSTEGGVSSKREVWQPGGKCGKRVRCGGREREGEVEEGEVEGEGEVWRERCGG